MQHGKAPVCPHCGAGVTAAQLATLGHCGGPLCATRHRAALAERALAEREAGTARLAAQMEALAGEALERIAAEEGVAREALLRGPVPHRAPVLAAAEPGRRQAFLAHVAALCDAAFAVPEAEIPPVYTRETGAPPPVAAPACAACRGKCCERGHGTHAFVKLGTIQGFRLAEPGITKADILARYAAHFPEESSAGGCLFQGPAGCTLPRHARARVCNSYHCALLESLIARAAPGRVVAVAAFEGEERIAAMSVMSADGSWREVGGEGTAP